MNLSNSRLLILDDEEGMCKLLKSILGVDGYDIVISRSAMSALDLISREHFDLAIVDIKMPEMDGIEFLEKATEIKPGLNFIMISAYGSIENAVDSMKMGAFDYITKPFEREQIKISIRKALEHAYLLNENARMKRELAQFHISDSIRYASRKMNEIMAFAAKIANSSLSVLITGESGTGKEVVARYIHENSSRKEQPFIPVQCTLLPVNLLESELFGFRKGAFTGANESRTGLFEQANNGTIFLDEIGDIDFDIQGKLLRFLQEREVRRIGDTKSITLDVRLISATNKNLEKLIKEKEFREDLYFRLKVLTIHMPPLRERKEDIPYLVQYFISEENKRRDSPVDIDSRCIKKLISYDWPGNIRELKNCIESASAICENDLITVEDILGISSTQGAEPGIELNFKEAKNIVIENFEKRYLADMLFKHKGVISAASRSSGIDRKTFWQLLKKYGIEPENFR